MMLKRELAAVLLRLRADYEQATADNARLRTALLAAELDNEGLRAEIEALTIRLRMVEESTVAAARGVASPTDVEKTVRSDEVVNMCARTRLEYRSDTVKRISIKHRASVRFNSELARYQVKVDGKWVDADDVA